MFIRDGQNSKLTQRMYIINKKQFFSDANNKITLVNLNVNKKRLSVDTGSG